MTTKRVWLFSDINTADTFGYKGAELAKLTKLEIPVPFGFNITPETCNNFIENNRLPDGLMDEIKSALKEIENKTGKKFGDKENPLLISVRSSCKQPTNGMMEYLYNKLTMPELKSNFRQTPLYILERLKDNVSGIGTPETVLNLGLNDEIVENLAISPEKRHFYHDIYRRFLASYACAVFKMNKLKYFDLELENLLKRERVTDETKLSNQGIRYLVNIYKNRIKEYTGKEIAQNPYTQLEELIKAIYLSWHNNNSSQNDPVTITIQAMVFGNSGNNSATGVIFTRHPMSGDKSFYGRYLNNAQGEDIVNSIRTPKQINELKTEMPEAYERLVNISELLETNFKTVREIEFTIENNKLYILQTRKSYLSTEAYLKFAVELVEKGLLNKETVIQNINPYSINEIPVNEYFNTFFDWVDEYKTINVCANIYHTEEIEDALSFRADAVGLCRTQYLIEQCPDIINSWVYNLIKAESSEERYQAVLPLKKQQYQDYYHMLKVFDNKIFTVRLTDCRLEFFFPEKDDIIEEIITRKAFNQAEKDDEKILELFKEISETNPMLGLRGSRLAFLYPELFEMQVEAFFEACCDLVQEGYTVKPHVMTAFISNVNELKFMKNLIDKTANKIMEQKNTYIKYQTGTMIEIPRAALTADEIAKYCDFFSFGTNDLTQMTFGYSRYDTNFISTYIQKNILETNPFIQLDQNGVGQLMKIAITKGKEANPNLTCTVCGIQMRDLASVKFAIEMGIENISIDSNCIPQAKLLSAQLALKKLYK